MAVNSLYNIVDSYFVAKLSEDAMTVSSDENVIRMALEYSDRAFLFSTVIALTLVFEKVFQAVGKMKISMFSMMCGFAANIILDPLMIFGIGFFPAMGISGAAYATGTGQVLSLVVYLIFCKVDPLPLKMERRYLRLERKVAARMYSVGISATVSLALPSLLISVLNGILAGFSEKYVLVLGVYYKLQTFIYLTANGIIQGIRPLM